MVALEFASLAVGRFVSQARMFEQHVPVAAREASIYTGSGRSGNDAPGGSPLGGGPVRTYPMNGGRLLIIHPVRVLEPQVHAIVLGAARQAPCGWPRPQLAVRIIMQTSILTLGTRLGVYEIGSAIGAGGPDRHGDDFGLRRGHVVCVRTMAFRIVRSLRMQAVSATFLGFPAARSRR